MRREVHRCRWIKNGEKWMPGCRQSIDRMKCEKKPQRGDWCPWCGGRVL